MKGQPTLTEKNYLLFPIAILRYSKPHSNIAFATFSNPLPEKVFLISTADANRFQQHKNVVDASKKAV